MAEETNPTHSSIRRSQSPIIYYEEPPARRPPLTETGVIGWLRENLFGSVSDTILTFIALIVIVYSGVGFLKWSIADADWGVINRNLRLFMNGRYPNDQIYRTSYVMLIIALLGGISWSLMGHARRWMAVAAVILLAVLFVTPALTNQIPAPSGYQYISANSDILPTNPIYLVKESQIKLELIPADPRAGIPVGFSDVDSATEAGQAQLAAAMYDQQLARFEAGVEGVKAPEALPESDVQVTIHLLKGDTLETIGTLEAGVNTDPQTAEGTFDIPVSGWYVIQNERAGAYGAYWVVVDGFAVVSSSSEELASLVEEYGPIPEIDGAKTVLADSAFLKFRGSRTFAEYMGLEVGPFFEAGRVVVLALIVTVSIGYLIGTLGRGRAWAGRVLNYAWAFSFIIIVFLLRGFSVDEHYSEVTGFGLLLLTLAFAVPALYGALTVRYTAADDRNWFYQIGMILVIGFALLTFFTGWNWVVLIVEVAGTGLILFALDNDSRRLYLRVIGIGMAIVVVYFVVMQILFGQQIKRYLDSGGEETWALVFVPTDRWGGLFLTLALALVSIIASFPIGVLLALGRRSTLPVIRWFSIGTIETVRGVPLITILFMASIMVPLLSPSLANVDSVVRAMIGMTLFSGAYVAEIVRGGLQAIPQGQTEAAKAVGLSNWQMMFYIILPQALRAVIPALVGQFISLFKDTSLVFIIGLIELLGIARTVINQAEYIGTQREALVFIGIIYFIGSYAMSSASRRIEESGVGSVRRM